MFPLLACSFLLVSVGCANNDSNPSNDSDVTPAALTPSVTYSVSAQFAHDTSYFTEGLEFYNGKLLESTGLNGESKLVQYDLATGKLEKEVQLDARFFGEGITVFRDTLYQLTYRESTVLVYDAKTFKKIKELPWTGEGWGLTHDSTSLIATNGSNNLYYYQPGTMKLLKTVPITENGNPAVNLNELEYVNGFIYANQWQYPYILKIDPVKGEVVAKLDLTSIHQQEKALNSNQQYLNGLAYNPQTKKFYATGKYWSKIYELAFAY